MTSSHPGIFGDDPRAAVEEAASWGMHRMMVPGFMFLGDTEQKMGEFAARVF